MKQVINKNKEWYTTYIDDIKEDDYSQWINLKNQRGQIYSCTVLKGISINYFQIFLDSTLPVESFHSETLLMAYCIEGRVEGELKNGSISYLPEQYFCVSSDVFQFESISFPLKKYIGISIRIDLEDMDDEAKRILDYFKFLTGSVKYVV